MIADIYKISGFQLNSLPSDLYDKKFYLLPTSTEDNSLHNFITFIATFNISKINKNLDDFIIEFYFGTPLDCKTNFMKNKTMFPSLSSITLLDNFKSQSTENKDCLDSYFFTDINFESYKYKKYRKQEKGKKVVMTQINKNMHIIYNSQCANIFIGKKSPLVLFVNLWDKNACFSEKNELISIFDVKLSIDNLQITEVTKQQIELNNNLSNEFYENILYKNNMDSIKFLLMVFKEHNSEIIEFTDIYDISIEETKKLKNKYGDVINDVLDVNKSYIKHNRFYQRFIKEKLLSNEICNWILNETEIFVNKYGWDIDNFKNYPTLDLKLYKLTKIHDYFLNYELAKIMKYIEKSYCLPSETRFDITDLTILKYSNELQNYLDSHVDSSFITFNIALNNITEYDGGGTYFDDGLTVKIDKGDMLIHCGKVVHRGLTINKGVRYILVGFINIVYET